MFKKGEWFQVENKNQVKRETSIKWIDSDTTVNEIQRCLMNLYGEKPQAVNW